MWFLTTAVHVWVLKKHLLPVSEVLSVIEDNWCFFHLAHIPWQIGCWQNGGGQSHCMQMIKLKIFNLLFSGHTSLSIVSPTTNLTPSDLFIVIQKVLCSLKERALLCLGDALNADERCSTFQNMDLCSLWIHYLTCWSRWLANKYLFPHFVLEYLAV